MSTRLRARGTSIVVLALLAGFVVLLGPAPAATAAGVTTTTAVTYSCTTSAFGIEYTDDDADYTVTFTAPATATNGQTIKMTWTIDRLPTTPPIAIHHVSTTTRASVSVERPSKPLDYPTQTSSPSAVVAVVPSATPLPGTKTLTMTYRALVNTSGQQMKVRPSDMIVDAVQADDGYQDAEVYCAPVTNDVIATITVNGAPPACVATNTCNGTQTFVGTVTPNALTVDYHPAGAGWLSNHPVGSFDSGTGPATSAVVPVNFGRVTDTRGGSYGWSMTASFDGKLKDGFGHDVGGATMTVADLTCNETVGASGSAPSDSGTAGGLSSPRTLCTVDPGVLGSTGGHGGQWDVNGSLQMTVPPFARQGTYVATVVVMIS